MTIIKISKSFHRNFTTFSSSCIIFTFFLDLNDYHQNFKDFPNILVREIYLFSSSSSSHQYFLSWFQWLSSEIQKVLKKISFLLLFKEFSEKLQRNSISFPSSSPYPRSSICILFHDPTDYQQSFRELETINSITSRNAWYYYGAILGQPAHQTKTIRARPIIELPPRLGRSNSLGVATSSRPSVQLASCGVKLRFTASNPSFQVGSNDLSTSRLNYSINAPLITIFIEWIPGRRRGKEGMRRSSFIERTRFPRREEVRKREDSLSRLDDVGGWPRELPGNTTTYW